MVPIYNLVFEGGGVLGIAYLGVLDFLYEKKILPNIQKIAGTSAGAITASITSFNLPFPEIKQITDTLNYAKIPQKNDLLKDKKPSSIFVKEFQKIFETDVDCIYRLIKRYGWYSSEYLYQWLQEQIANQFDLTKKLPPYTFTDFKNTSIHKEKRPFLDLYIIGTDISGKCSELFSFYTTPKMEVAKAVQISMSIPLFFESIDMDSHTFSDGGVLQNYPIHIFDNSSVNFHTLGARFISKLKYDKINNIMEYITSLLQTFGVVQKDMYNHSPMDQIRSIEINPGNVSFVDFDISPGDAKYDFLYHQGYQAAKHYFEHPHYPPVIYD